MVVSVKDLLAEAHASVPKISADEARRLIEERDALLVDVRDGTEVAQTGKLQGAVNVSRGMIEFRADDSTPYHDAQFRKDRPVILYCASGGRSALAGSRGSWPATASSSRAAPYTSWAMGPAWSSELAKATRP